MGETGEIHFGAAQKGMIGSFQKKKRINGRKMTMNEDSEEKREGI